MEILSSMSGCSACSCTLRMVGAMMKSERKSESPINTWLGGNCGVPSAWRKNESTITMRVNEVTDSTSAVPNDNAVRMRKILTAEEPPPARASSLLAPTALEKSWVVVGPLMKPCPRAPGLACRGVPDPRSFLPTTHGRRPRLASTNLWAGGETIA